jgi:hypothetical protein
MTGMQRHNIKQVIVSLEGASKEIYPDNEKGEYEKDTRLFRRGYITDQVAFLDASQKVRVSME